MTPKTLSLNKSGWTSFFSFIPESMTHIDNKMYSFKNGQIYAHEDGDVNTFYGTKYKSSIRTVLNENPVERKVFKTLAMNGDVPWDVQMSTDIQNAGFISKDMLEQKEGVWYAHVRVPNGLPENISNDLKTMSIRDLIGIGESVQIDTDVDFLNVSFPIGVRVSSQASCGDYIFGLRYNPTATMVYLGILDNIVFDSAQNQTSIVIDRTGSITYTWQPEIFMTAIKNRAAESTGIIGQYCIINMERIPDSETEELFVLESEVMRSNP